MTKSIIIKAFLNGIAGWLIFALVFSLIHNDTSFANMLTDYEAILAGLTTFVGCMIGYTMREKRA